MDITYKNFRLVKDQERYDLYMTKIVESKDKETKKVIKKEVEVLIGYSFLLPSVIQRMVEILSDTGEETKTLKEYLEVYRKTKQEVVSELLG